MFTKPSKNDPNNSPDINSIDSSSETGNEDSTDHLPAVGSPQNNIENKFAELKALIKSSDTSSQLFEMSEIEIQYRVCLMENISEGVIFVNRDKEITCWNRSAEMITGLASTNMIGTEFTPEVMGLNESKNDSNECAVTKCLKTRKQSSTECTLVGKSGRQLNIDLTVVPVIHSMQCHGAVILIKDLSANTTLKKQLTDLKNSSSLDPLTNVANRAEFERTLRKYVGAHQSTESTCSLIVCDIDFFKMVNDTYGHNVGDQALIAFAQTLQQFVRSRDIVARYGGEEFVILCANCDIDGAASRAEEIRMSLNRTPQAMLDGKTMSASFGVAQMRENEDITDFFIRADKALYEAKQNGRNRVEKAKDETEQEPVSSETERSPATGVEWKNISRGSLFCEEYCTSTPADLLADKLRGYILECDAYIRTIEPNYASVTVLATDRKVPSKKTHFRVDIEFHEVDEGKRQVQTYIRITIFPPRQRMFRRIHEELHQLLVTDIRRFFMITEDSAAVTLNPAATSSGRD